METINITYLGDLRTKAIHTKSGNELITDAPTDNQGKGEFFSPTDLVATALGSCILITIGIISKRHHFNIDGTKLKVTKIMADSPRRISEIIIEFDFPQKYPEEIKKRIEQAANACPVSKSLHPELKKTLIFNW